MKMSHIAAGMIALMAAAVLTACTASVMPAKSAVDADASASIVGPAVPDSKAKEQSRIAVIYFSEPEGVPKHDVQGTTQYAAQLIQEQTGADIFRIERQAAYPADHDGLTKEAKDEADRQARPAIADTIGDLSRYDTVFLGYPMWWHNAPMPVYTFLDTYDLSGKKVYLFVTHGGDGLGQTPALIQAAEPEARVDSRALAIYCRDVTSVSPIYAWLGNLGFK